MKKISILVVMAVVFSMITVSCDFLLDALGGDGGEKNFYAQDLTTKAFYTITAKLLAQNELCEVWADTKSGVSETTAKQIANTYKTKIYGKMMDTFGWIDTKSKMNTMEFADSFCDENGKLTILLLDIRDGYTPGNGHVAGYFASIDFYTNAQATAAGFRSNETDMIYMDTYPSTAGSEDFYETLAHEMQHLMNFAASLAFRSKTNQSGQITEINTMDTWINEGLSESTAFIYSGKHDEGRLYWYNEGTKSINKGNNFFIWDNREEDSVAILDDYATVYLFFQWLRIHNAASNNPYKIYYDIHTSSYSNYQAVLNALKTPAAWDSLLQTWLAANHIQSNTGSYGYGNASIDSDLNKIKKHYAPGGANTINLFPGEGVFSIANANPNPVSGTNINYAYINGGAVSGSYAAGSTLLTFNKNTDLAGKTEAGTITGAAAQVAVPSRDISRSAQKEFLYKIGAGDVIRRRSGEQNIPLDFSLTFDADRKDSAPSRALDITLPLDKADIIRYREGK